MMAAHTPGPWQVEQLEPIDFPGRLNYAVTCNRKGIEVMAITGIVGAGDDAESIANASLIAAAPDLLAALRQFMETGVGNSTNFHAQTMAWDAANEAIAKAEGRQS